MHSATFHFSVVHTYIIYHVQIRSDVQIRNIQIGNFNVQIGNGQIENVQIGNTQIRIGNVEIRNWISSILP